MARFAVVIARMRSGTTAFRQVLSSNPKISSLGEVFHSNSEQEKFHFYKYFLEFVNDNPEISLPSPENREALLRRYLDHLNTLLNLTDKLDRVLLFGVNYNSLHALNAYWQNPLSPPYLIALFRKLNIGIIHLCRINHLETLVSEVRARTSGVWHIKGEVEQCPAPVALNTQNLLVDLEERSFEMQFLRQWLRAHGKVLEVTYEEAFQLNNTLSHRVLERCATFLDVPNDFSTGVEYRRTGTTSLRQAISNYDAVAETLSGTKFARFLTETRAGLPTTKTEIDALKRRVGVLEAKLGYPPTTNQASRLSSSSSVPDEGADPGGADERSSAEPQFFGGRGKELATAGKIRLDESFVSEDYWHLDISIYAMTLDHEVWPHAKFKFCLSDSGSCLEFREKDGWPIMFTEFPGVEQDTHGPVLHLFERDLQSLAEWQSDRDRSLVQAIATLLTTAVEAATGQAEFPAPARDRWVVEAHAFSDTCLRATIKSDAASIPSIEAAATDAAAAQHRSAPGRSDPGVLPPPRKPDRL